MHKQTDAENVKQSYDHPAVSFNCSWLVKSLMHSNEHMNGNLIGERRGAGVVRFQK